MAGGYLNNPQDPIDQLFREIQALRSRLAEIERPTGTELLSVDAAETFGAPNLLSVTSSSTLVGVEALIGAPLAVVRPGRYLITCVADVQTRLRGTGGTINVSIDVKDQTSPGSSVGIASPMTFGHTANDNVQLSLPVVATGIVGLAADASLVCRVVYSITPGTTDGRLEIPSVRLSVQGLKPGQS